MNTLTRVLLTAWGVTLLALLLVIAAALIIDAPITGTLFLGIVGTIGAGLAYGIRNTLELARRGWLELEHRLLDR